MVEAAGETFGDLALLVLVFFKSVEDDSKFPKDVGKGRGTGLTPETLRECVICEHLNSKELSKSLIPCFSWNKMCFAGGEHRSSHRVGL